MSNYGRKDQGQKKFKNENISESTKTVEDCSPTVKIFLTYQKELDERYDKYERLIKKSRDLTIESKRIIFLLHRVSSSDEDNEKVLDEAEIRLGNLYKFVISGISLELCPQEVFQYIRAFSPGLQEFVEAISFYHYLKHGNIISIEEVHKPGFLKKLPQAPSDAEEDKAKPAEETSLDSLQLPSLLTPIDFVLGIADLTGELMRKCINSVGAGNIEEPFKLCLVLQSIYESFLFCSNYNRELKRKLSVLKTSLQKVENACYAIKIRGSEIPKHMLADFFSSNDEFKDGFDCDI